MTTSQCARAAESRSRWKEIVSHVMAANNQTWSAEKEKPSNIQQQLDQTLDLLHEHF